MREAAWRGRGSAAPHLVPMRPSYRRRSPPAKWPPGPTLPQARSQPAPAGSPLPSPKRLAPGAWQERQPWRRPREKGGRGCGESPRCAGEHSQGLASGHLSPGPAPGAKVLGVQRSRGFHPSPPGWKNHSMLLLHKAAITAQGLILAAPLLWPCPWVRAVQEQRQG